MGVGTRVAEIVDLVALELVDVFGLEVVIVAFDVVMGPVASALLVDSVRVMAERMIVVAEDEGGSCLDDPETVTVRVTVIVEEAVA